MLCFADKAIDRSDKTCWNQIGAKPRQLANDLDAPSAGRRDRMRPRGQTMPACGVRSQRSLSSGSPDADLSHGRASWPALPHSVTAWFIAPERKDDSCPSKTTEKRNVQVETFMRFWMSNLLGRGPVFYAELLASSRNS